MSKEKLPFLKLNEKSQDIRLDNYLHTWQSPTFDSTLNIPAKVSAHLQEGFNTKYSGLWNYFVFEFEYVGNKAQSFYFMPEKPTVQRLVFKQENLNTHKTINYKTTGTDFPFIQRGTPYQRNFVFPIKVLPHQKYRIILVAHSGIDSLNAQLMLLNEQEFFSQQMPLQIGMIIGAFLVALLVSLIIIWGYFHKHQKSKLWLWYLSYPVYILCSILNALAHEGFAYQYLWSKSPTMAFFSKTIFLAIGAPSLLIFRLLSSIGLII